MLNLCNLRFITFKLKYICFEDENFKTHRSLKIQSNVAQPIASKLIAK